MTNYIPFGNRLRSGSLWVLLFMLLAACQSGKDTREHSHAANGSTYTCPMHPQVVQQGAGICPICHMDLVQTETAADTVSLTEELTDLLSPAQGRVVSSIRTVKPEKRGQKGSKRLYGSITYDPRQVYTLPARFGGRIEKLLVRYNFQPVQQGQKIMEVYSPELLAAQKELLFVLQTDSHHEALMAAARQKLRLLGIADQQIESIVASGAVQHTLPVYSPYDGYVVASAALPPAGTGTPGGSAMISDGMGATAQTEAAAAVASSLSSEISLQEGMYVEKGQALFRVINPVKLWAEFDAYGGEACSIQAGDTLEIEQQNGQTLKETVNFVQPFYQKGTNFKKVRVYLDNTDAAFRVGQLVSASVHTAHSDSYWLPRTAVLDLGLRKVVFVKEGGAFQAVEVQTGCIVGEQIELLQGIGPQTAVAYHAQLMIDSESFVSVANK